MFKLSTKKGNIVIEMDDTTATAVIQTLWLAIGDAIPALLAPEKVEAMEQVEKVLRETFYQE